MMDRMSLGRVVGFGAVAMIFLAGQGGGARGDILRWDSWEVIPGTTGIELSPGIDLSGWNRTGHDLSYAYINADLTGASLQGSSVVGAMFDGGTIFTNVIFTDAIITEAMLRGAANRGFTKEQLYSTASYQTQNLRGVDFRFNDDLTGWNFAGQNLTNTRWDETNLTGASFTNATINGADFSYCNLTKEQLYSTTSYKAKDLQILQVNHKDLSGWNFQGQNLSQGCLDDDVITNADLSDANLSHIGLARSNLSGSDLSNSDLSYSYLYKTNFTNANLSHTKLDCTDMSACNFTNADLSHADMRGNFLYLSSAIFVGADLRGVVGFSATGVSSTANMLWPDGHIHGLNLTGNKTLVVRNNVIAVTVDNSVTLDATSSLKMVLDGDLWTSALVLNEGVQGSFGGCLEVTLASGFMPDEGDQFDLFNGMWSGQFDRISLPALHEGMGWNTSGLYSAGVISVVAIPEPGSLAWVGLGMIGLLRWRRR